MKDRGRTLVYHQVYTNEEARELERVYLSLGYAPDKIVLTWTGDAEQQAA